MTRALISLPILLLLAACATPQERCLQQVTRDVSNLDRLIAESQKNIERGYAVETRSEYVETWGWCFGGWGGYAGGGYGIYGAPMMCDRGHTVDREYPVSIDIDAERRKLKGMVEKRKQLAARTEPMVASCRAQYPN